MPLKILSYDELYGWTMDRVVSTIGKKNNCTFCGVFRRQALDRGAASLGVDHIVTGHNADDIAETVLMNSEYICSTILFLIGDDESPHSHARRHRATREVHRDLHARRRYNTAIKTV
jgi:PP-loop superfamily ATP-utilizing enzyme